jgi:hypothetical protein
MVSLFQRKIGDKRESDFERRWCTDGYPADTISVQCVEPLTEHVISVT